ncbi:MAG TPA: PPOX class F420-dependent oxidoreductase [Tepidiformaceae bacterium]|nr:PPOX class F420-dependent oxidoreductase [Tepidiformaceae bacterium]
MTNMTEAQASAFLRETRIAKLATLNADGSPNVVPVWFEWDGRTAALFTYHKSPKLRRIRRDDRVALSVEEPMGAKEAWVTIEGTAAVEATGGIELARRLIVRYYDEQRVREILPGWEKMAPEWVVVRITPKRIRSSAPGTS